MSTLDQLCPGQRCIVCRINCQGPIRRRLLDMGLTNGVEIEVIRTAPMGDPVEYRLRGYHLSLRKSEASQVQVLE
ncbi:MAG: ferrous iron transport protein A [Chloroflexi bacterium]|nr:ferrous iron transport protein A [Chloroflexota bacterium]